MTESFTGTFHIRYCFILKVSLVRLIKIFTIFYMVNYFYSIQFGKLGKFINWMVIYNIRLDINHAGL